MTEFKHHKIGKRGNKFVKAIFILLGFFGLLVLMSVQSDTYAATNTNQTYDFLDSAFWAGNPTNAEIIAALYGTNSAYTNGWSSNPCNTGNMTVVKQPATSTQLPSLSANRIYVLQTGAINIEGTVTIPSCTAIVSKVDGGTTVYSNNQITNDGMFYVGRGKGGVIIDNINFEGTHYGTNGTHSGNFNCIYLYGDDASNGATSNISVNNSKVARCENGIKVGLTKINYINLTNITLVNNGYGIYLFGAGRVSMNNIVGQSYVEIYSDQASYISINNTAFSSLFDTNIYFNNGTGLVVNNAIASVYTTTNGCIVNNLIGFVGSSNSSSIKCKLYGTLKIPSIGTCPDTAVQQQGSWSSLGWNAGASPQDLGCYNWNYVINPIANGVNPLYPWNTTTLRYLYYGCDGQPLNCFSIQSFGAAFDALSSNYKYSFGSQVPEQQSPVRWNNTTLSLWNTDWCSNCFIGSNLKKLSSISSTLPAIVTGSTSLTVTGNGGGFVSKYNVLGPHITSQQYNKTIGVNTTVYWTNGDGPKAVIFQVTGSNYYAMHFMGETERSSSGPSFTLNGTTVDECSSKTWNAFSSYPSNGLATNPFGHQFPGESLSWSSSPSLTYVAGNTAGNYTFTGQLKNSSQVITTRTATIVVNNSQPTGNNFTGHSSVGSTARTVNWKTLSNASEGNCGNGSLTASVQSQGSKGSCSVAGNNITYTPTSSQGTNQCTDQCTIKIRDNENTTKDVVVYRGGVTCGGGNGGVYGTVNINNGAVATNNSGTTLYLTYSSAVKKVRFSCDNSTWSARKNTGATYSWNIINGSGCSNSQGTKTVYAEFSGGGATSTSQDDIIYDRTAPSVSISLNANGATVTFTEDLAGLSGGQTFLYSWQTGNINTCSPVQSDYIPKSLSYTDGALFAATIISSQGLSGTYHLCVYRGLYDRAGNREETITHSTNSFPYSYNSAGCEWVVQPVSPIGPNNVNLTQTVVVACQAQSLMKSQHPRNWLNTGAVSSIINNWTYSNVALLNSNQIAQATYTYNFIYNNVKNLSYSSNYYINVKANGVSNGIPVAAVPSDPIRFDFEKPVTVLISPQGGTMVSADFQVNIKDSDNRDEDGNVSTCYYQIGSGTINMRTCSDTITVQLSDCSGNTCKLRAWAEDDLGNIGTGFSVVYNISYSAPTVLEAEMYVGNYYFNGIQGYFNNSLGRVSLRAPYNGDGVTSCQYKVDNGSWTNGTKDNHYCKAENLTWTATKTITFRAYNGSYGTGIATTFYFDGTAPYFTDKTYFGTGCYNTGQTSYFSFVDTGAGIDWANSIIFGVMGADPVCTITTQGTGQTCYIKPEIFDFLGNAGGGNIYSNPVNLDWTAPNVSATRNDYSCTNQDVRINIVASDNICGLAVRPYTYVLNGVTGSSVSQSFYDVPETGTLTVIVSDVAGNKTTYSTGIDNIDKISPVVIVSDVSGYECSSLTATASATDQGCGNGSLTYSWDGGETFGSATSKTLSSNEVGSQTIGLSVKDGAGAGNITNELVDFTWNDAPLSVTSTKNLGTITGSKTIANVLSDLSALAGPCETITPSLVECTNASGTLNGNQLVIQPTIGLNNQAGSCILSFTDGDTYKSATYNFTVSTLLDQTVTVSNATVTASCPTTTTFTATTNGGGTLSVSSSDTSVATVSISNGTVTITPKKAGSATITVTAAATANYNTGTATVSLTVNRGTQTVTLNPTSLSLTYGGSAGTFTASTVANGGALSVKSSNTNVATANLSNGTVTVSPVNVGSATMTVTAARTACYNTGTASLTATVGKADATCPTLTAYSGTYDGASHTIGVTGGAGGTIRYRTSTNGSWTTTKPNATNASTTTVYVQVSGDSNHNTVDCGSKTIKIGKKAVTVTAENKSMTYGGSAPTFTYTVAGAIGSETAVSGTPTYTVKNSGGTQVTVNSSLAAGTYTITPSGLTAGSNYTITYANGTLTVNQAKTATPGSCNSLTYNGSAQTLAAGGSYVTYSNNSATNAGTYTVTVTSDGNHQFSDGAESKTLSCTINRKPIAEPSCTSATYNGSSQTLLAAHTSGGYTNEAIVGTNAGSYSKTLTLNSNYQWSAGSNVTSNRTKTCTIAQAKTATAGSCNTLTYNGNTQTLATGGSYVTYSNNSKKDAGTYTVTVTTDDNHQLSNGNESTTLSCTIGKKGVTVTAENKSMTYGGSAPTFTYTVAGAIGSETAVSGTPTYTVKNSGGTQATVNSSLAAGTYTITPSGLTAGANYSITSYGNGTLTVSQAKTATPGSCNTLTYNGSAQTLATGGTYVTYTNNSATNAGTYTVTVTTDANHQFSNGGESTTLSCTINRKLVDEPSCTSATYNGSSQTLLAAHTNGGYTNEAIVGTNAGSYSKTLTLNSNYQWSAGSNVTSNRTKTCTIAKYNLSNATVSAADQTYDGTAKKPAPTVKMGNTTIASSEYDVTYTNNTNAGTASFTVTAKSTSTNFTGSKGGTFTINSGTISVTTADGTYSHDGNGHVAGTLTVTVPTNGYTVKYGTSNGTYNLTSMPSYTGVGNYTTYYQVTAPNYNIKTGTITTTINDITAPTFTFNNNSGAECAAGTLTITNASDNGGVGLHATPYKFGNGSWGTVAFTTISAQQPGSVTVTGYVRDALDHQRSATATYTFNNVAPTADNVTVNSVGTGKTVNWKTLSNATEGNCGNGALSASLKTNSNSSMGSCTVNGDNITFVATSGANGTATCVITIKDNENSTKDITITWNGVSRPIPQISFANPTPAHNAAVTQNRFTTKMNITNIDEIQSFEYKYDNTPYDIMSGLVLMYNFDKVSSLGESNTLVKDLSHNGKDGTVNGATWTSNGKRGGAYSFDGNDYIKFAGLSLTNYTIVLWEKTLAGSWRHIVITNGTKYINGLSSSVNNSRVDLSNGYIGRVNSSYYNGIIDEVRIYNRALSQDEVQFLYKSNLKKTSENTWEFETLNTCLNATGTYNYTGKVVSYVDTQAATGRKLTTNIPLVSVSGTGYDFGTHTASGSKQVLRGTMGTLTVTDSIGNTGWKVYLSTSKELVGQSTNQKIDTQNLKFKANNLVYNGLYDGVSNSYVSFGNGVSTTEYRTARSSCLSTQEHCLNDYNIMEYIVRAPRDSNDFMCSEVGTYSDNTQIELEIPAWQIQDTYTGTLWITLQDDFGLEQNGTRFVKQNGNRVVSSN